MYDFLSEEQIIELLERGRNRGSYAQFMYDEFGIKIPPRKPMTRKEKLQAKWNDYKSRVRKICQIIWRGYCDEEVEW